jgi:glycosyltransferase involved in cell wall biosynthesis
MMDLPRAAVLHSELTGGGGSEAAAVWLAQAIEDICRVTLVSMGPVDLARLNAIYGTSLSPARTETVSLPVPRVFGGRFDALRAFRLGRWAKQNGRGFDLMVSSYNVMDFGKRGLQLIADFSFDDGLRRSLHPRAAGIEKVFYGKSPFRALYLWLGRRLSNQTRAGWKENATYASSGWTRDLFERRFGLKAGVLYPPVAADFAPVPWEGRQNGFVVLARMSPEKQVERTIAILDEVRGSGHDIHLHILGREDHRRYAESVKRLCRARGDWARFEGFATGEKKKAFLTAHRYGLSGCRHEAFGIAVAEMAAAGSIVWVPRAGGQVEIVGHEDLTFEDDRDAARKIVRVLEDGRRQAELGLHLSRRASLFSTRRFVEEARRIVEDFLGQGGRP